MSDEQTTAPTIEDGTLVRLKREPATWGIVVSVKQHRRDRWYYVAVPGRNYLEVAQLDDLTPEPPHPYAEPTTALAGRLSAARMSAAVDVVRAIVEEGPAPHLHLRAINRLRGDWPTLYGALVGLIQSYGHVMPPDAER